MKLDLHPCDGATPSLSLRGPGPLGLRLAAFAKFPALCLAGALLTPWAPAAWAQQGVDLTAGPTDYTTWSLFGSASAQNTTPGNGYAYSILELTVPGSGDQAGAAFAPTALPLDFNQAFRFDFNFYIQNDAANLRGDGLTFALTTTPGLGSTGGGGSDLGYAGQSSSSVAFAIDTFNFDGEPVSPSLQILTGGSVSPVAVTETGLGDSIRNAAYQWFGSLAYDPTGNNAGVLTGNINNAASGLGSFSVQANVDFDALGLAGQQVFYGFTASNGLATDGHATSWGTAVSAVPEPQSYALMLASLGAIGALARRRRADET